MSGVKLTAKAAAKTADVVRRVQSAGAFIAGAGIGASVNSGRQFWVGKIRTEGPDSEADYADNRYWAELHRVSNTSDSLTQAAAFSVAEDDEPDYIYTTITNIAETVLATHLLQKDELIRVYCDWDFGHSVTINGKSTTQREPRYWTDTTPALHPRLKITGNTQIDDYVWSYSGIMQVATFSGGRVVWSNKSGASEWEDLVFNDRETNNPTSAGVVQSTGGVDTDGDDFPAGADVLPLPDGLVLPFETLVIGGTRYYIVSASSGIDGTCT